MDIVRSDEEINEQLNRAADGVDFGTQYQGGSYEQGMDNFALWLRGDSDEPPLPEPHPKAE